MQKSNVRAPRKRYSETLRKLAPILAQDPNGADMLRVLVSMERMSGPDIETDIAEAVYWIGANYHNGQGCPLYAAMCATRFRPGACAKGPEVGSLAEIIYTELGSKL